MSEFHNTSTEFSETDGIDVPETNDWTDFDSAETDDINIDTAESISAGDIPDLSSETVFDGCDIQSEAEKAADYARAFGFDKAADYIERHYDGGEFIPGDPIPDRKAFRSAAGADGVYPARLHGHHGYGYAHGACRGLRDSRKYIRR